MTTPPRPGTLAYHHAQPGLATEILASKGAARLDMVTMANAREPDGHETEAALQEVPSGN